MLHDFTPPVHVDVHPRLTQKAQELREKLERKRTFLRYFIRLVMAFLFIFQINGFRTTIFSELAPELQNHVVIQDLNSGKVGIYLLIPALIFAGIAGILFSVFLKITGRSSE